MDWTRSSREREIMTGRAETFRTYTSGDGWVIEKWDGGVLWGVFDPRDVFCTTRNTLAGAKVLAEDLAKAEHAARRPTGAELDRRFRAMG
jgi:hypothetical protein